MAIESGLTELFSDEELLKSIQELDEEIVKAVQGDDETDESMTGEDESSESLERAMDDDSGEQSSDESSDESESDESLERAMDDESSSSKSVVGKGLLAGKEVNRAGGAGAVDHKAPHNAITKHGKKGHFRSGIEKAHSEPGMGVNVASQLNPGGKDISRGVKGGSVAKSFSDVASPEAERTLDVTPFLAAQAEAMDSIAAVVNDLAKSLDGFGAKDDLLAKSVVDVGRGLIDTRKQLAEVFESLNDIRKGLRMPVRTAPKSTLAKSEAVERFESNEAPTLSKAQTAGVITDLVIKGLVDPMAVSAYEATGWMDRTTEQAVQAEITARFSRRA